MKDRRKAVRGKFPDDSRDRMLTRGRIVKIEPIKPTPKFWQKELFKTNDPRMMAHDCSTIFINTYLDNGWGPPLKDLGPMKTHDDLWDARINVT